MTGDAARVGALILVAVWVAIASACGRRPSAGSPCRLPDQLVCGGPSGALTCFSGVWVELPCRGPRGCARRGDTDECDDTVAVGGDPCPHNPPVDYACTTDRARALVCQNGRFSLWRNCRGPDKCEIVDGHNLRCDTTFGEAGDPCEKKEASACSEDRKTMLACDGSLLVPASSCRGPGGCRVERDTRKVDCDDSVAVEGDACDQAKRIACALDHKSELVCTEGKYVKKRECRQTDCRLEGNQLFCD